MACWQPESARSAADTPGGRRIEPQAGQGDLFPAILAKPVVFVVHPDQRLPQTFAFNVAPALLRLGHGLVLQSVHAAEPPDRLLVECHGVLAVTAKGIVAFKLG